MPRRAHGHGTALLTQKSLSLPTLTLPLTFRPAQTGFDSIRFMLGLTDGVKGTGVFRSFRRGTFAEAETDQPPAPTVDELIARTDVVLFVSSSCPFCKQAVAALDAAGVAHTVIERTSVITAALMSKTGTTSVPSAWVKGTYVGGCNDGPEVRQLRNYFRPSPTRFQALQHPTRAVGWDLLGAQCLSCTDWCLQSNVMTNSCLQAWMGVLPILRSGKLAEMLSA